MLITMPNTALVSGDEYSDLWELYGLKENPFSTNPLLLLGGIIPITCFIGRDKELDRMAKQFRSKGGSRTLIVGDVGVGKTSFVNFARYKAYEKGYFSPIREIAVQEQWNSIDFIHNTLYAIYITLKLTSQNKIISSETYDELSHLVAINEVTGRGWGLNILGSGVQYNQESTTSSRVPFMALHDLLAKIAEEVFKNTGKETILHYNNLERLQERNVRRIFEDLRDTLQIAHIHYVFVGNLIVDGVLQSMPRVSSIFSERVALGTMNYTEIENIIETRLKQLKISDEIRIIKPFDATALGVLYNLYRGNIRDILNSLNTAILEATKDRPIILNKDDVVIILKIAVEKRFLSRLPPKAKQILETILQAKNGEITNRGIATATKTSRPNVSSYLRDLESEGCIYLKRKNGKDKFWGARPEIHWMLLHTEKEDKRQKRLESEE